MAIAKALCLPTEIFRQNGQGFGAARFVDEKR
jgi:hypothetical protein